jgi:type II secretion system protein G
MMTRTATGTIVGIVLVGLIVSVAAVNNRPSSGIPDLNGKTVILDSVNPPTANLTLGVIGERQFVVLRHKRDDGLSFEYWKPLESLDSFYVFNSMEDALAFRKQEKPRQRPEEKDQEAIRSSPDQQVQQSSRREEIYINATKTQVRDLCNALNMYAVDVGNYPASEVGLQALVEPPPGRTVQTWHGPYIKYATVPLDPWDQKFHYTYQPEDASPTVTSAGPDGKLGTEDDIKGCPPGK